MVSGRGGSGGRGSSVFGRGPRRLEARANVWTPPPSAGTSAPAAARASASALLARATTTSAASRPPALTARVSIRKAAEAAEVASVQSTTEIEAHLKEVEERLAVVVAQEKEVRSIADEHLEREASLIKLLEDLYRRQREEREGTSQEPALLVNGVPSRVDGGQSSSFGVLGATVDVSSVAVTSADPRIRRAAVKESSRLDNASSTPQQNEKVAASVPTPLVSNGGGNAGPARTRHPNSSTRGGGAIGSTVDPAAASTAATMGGKDPDPNLIMAAAIGRGGVPGGDDLFTRDAGTIAEYISLMSYEATRGEAQAAVGGGRPVEEAERWHQPGLSLKEALDKAEAVAARPARLPNLLALATAIRPVDRATPAAANVAGGRASTATNTPSSGGLKRKSPDDAVAAPGAAAAAAMQGEAGETRARGLKRRRVDANAIMCPFELNGICNDDDCRYQHLDVYLPSTEPGTSSTSTVKPAAGTAGSALQGLASGPTNSGKVSTGTPVAGLSTAAESTVSRHEALKSKQHQLPTINFGGEEAQREAVSAAKRGSTRESSKTLHPHPPEKAAGLPGAGSPADGAGDVDGGGGGGGGVASGSVGEESDEETTSENGEEDFLALPAESVPAEADGGEVSSEAVPGATPTQRTNPAVLAAAFARAASGAPTKGVRGGSGGVKGVGGVGIGREERYYFEDGDGKTEGTASTALTEDQLSALEMQLNEDGGCDVEAWLLLAMHRLPRVGDSAVAVLNAVEGVARGASGPMGSTDQAAIKPALRTFVRPLERAEGEQAEALWLLYLRLFSFLPGKSEDALGMAEFALEKFPASRRIWRLYHSMLQKSANWSLSMEIACHRRQIEALLLMPSRAAGTAATQAKSQSGSGRSAARTEIPAQAGKTKSGTTNASGTETSGNSGEDPITAMIVFLLLERCHLLAEAGYTLQAAAETLNALGALVEGQPLWEWDSSNGKGRTTLLRAPSGGERGGVGGVQGGGEGTGPGTGGGTAGARSSDDGLPEGVSAALKKASRESRCVLWLTALHILVMGVFPRHALLLAEGSGATGGLSHGSSHDDTDERAPLLLWPKSCLSSESSAGLRFSTNAELQDATLKTFMTALSDVGLLPAKTRGAPGWAPPIKARGALLSSAAEAKAARTAGTAPEPSALEGPSLVLALNWLTFCMRRGGADAKKGRMMAFACCRRFQLARPDHPALLEHFLLEHAASKTRTLEGTLDEISRAFDADGVAAEALRERGEGEKKGSEEAANSNSAPTSGSRGDSLVPPPPSGDRLQAVYAFLRFVEARLEADQSEPQQPQAGDSTADGARRLLHEALVSLWTGTKAKTTDGSRSDPDRWLREEGGEPVRRALEGAKAALFRWADGGMSRIEASGRNAERRLSVIVFSLWVLGGPPAAIGGLDQILRAESFSGMSAERRRVAWLQRLEAAAILSTQRVQAPGADSTQGVREVALRALADPRTEQRMIYPTLAHFVVSALDGSVVRGATSVDKPGRTPPPSASAGATSATTSSFACDVLTAYASRYREARGGVDWVVAAEALGKPSAHTPYTAVALLRWVSGAGEDGDATAAALRTHARPYAEKALARHPGHRTLSGAVAALGAATGCPGRSQRVLEAALRAHPFSAALWQQRIALEAGFGKESTERTGATAAAAASSNVLLRLTCGKRVGAKYPSARVAKALGRILTAVSHPPSRREMKSFSLQGLLPQATGGAATTEAAAVEVPRSLFLLTGLVSLSLASNDLTSVPAAIGRLPVLRSLDISGNLLHALPLSLQRLSGTLRVLRAADNRLASPLSLTPLADLVGLRVLDLERNELSRFPDVVLTLTELRDLKLAGNKFFERPPTGLAERLPLLEELTLPEVT
ncbi:unnamed protein product [Scytosiphon promiscuus]